MSDSARHPVFDPRSWAPLRYLNLFRLVAAGLFTAIGGALNLGAQSPELFSAVSIGYLAAVLVLGFPDAARRLGLQRLITLQLVVDIVALTLLMWASGGYRSGLPVLMLVVLAGSSLVAEGRMVLFYAAMAAVAVLAENAWRAVTGRTAADFFAVGMVCIGFFGIAIVARLLAVRAKTNESLAATRGAALAQQQAVNVRIIRDMQDGVVVVGADGRVRQSNPRAGVLLGVDLSAGTELVRVLPDLTACIDGGLGAEGQLRRLGRAGRLLRCRVLGAGGEGGDALIYLTDFEEIQKQAQQIKLAALGRLTASIAHEIRNPLSAVTHAADLLHDEQRAEMRTRLTRIIRDNAMRIEAMVRDVLSLGRHDPALPEAVGMKAYLEELLTEFTLHDAAERVVFQVEVPDELTLAMDRGHLRQILWNVFANARRYCSGEPGAIRVRGESCDDGRSALHICDDGPGISDEDQAQVFEPFFTTHPKGTGLGLYIARELAEANDAVFDLGPNEPGAHFILTGRSQP